jgi:hypothetical protein
VSLRRDLAVSLVVQGTGAAAVLLATVVLGASLGPEAQGGFSATKAEIEFIAALAMFGLPQALFFYLKSGRLSASTARRVGLGTALAAVLIAAAFEGVAAGAGEPRAMHVLVVALAVGAAVAHGQFRSLALALDRPAWFNAITALPQWILLVAAALIASRFREAGWRVRSLSPAVRGTRATPAEIGRYGAAAWLSAALATAALLGVQRWTAATQSPAALGQLTMAMTWAQAPLTPIAYAAPLLFGRWIERSEGRSPKRLAWAALRALLAIASAVAVLSHWIPDLGLGTAYAGTTLALALLLVAAAAEAASRLLAVHANASGAPWRVVRAETARWLVLGSGVLLFPPATLLGVCLLWTLGAWSAAAVFFASTADAVRDEAARA